MLLRWRPHMYAAILTSSCKLKKKIKINQSMLLRWRLHLYAAILTSSCRLKNKIKIFAINQCCWGGARTCTPPSSPHPAWWRKNKNLCNQSMLLRWRPHMYAAILTSPCRLKIKIKIFAINQCCWGGVRTYTQPPSPHPACWRRKAKQSINAMSDIEEKLSNQSTLCLTLKKKRKKTLSNQSTLCHILRMRSMGILFLCIKFWPLDLLYVFNTALSAALQIPGVCWNWTHACCEEANTFSSVVSFLSRICSFWYYSGETQGDQSARHVVVEGILLEEASIFLLAYHLVNHPPPPSPPQLSKHHLKGTVAWDGFLS